MRVFEISALYVEISGIVAAKNIKITLKRIKEVFYTGLAIQSTIMM